MRCSRLMTAYYPEIPLLRGEIGRYQRKKSCWKKIVLLFRKTRLPTATAIEASILEGGPTTTVSTKIPFKEREVANRMENTINDFGLGGGGSRNTTTCAAANFFLSSFAVQLEWQHCHQEEFWKKEWCHIRTVSW